MILQINSPEELQQRLNRMQRNRERFDELIRTVTTKDGLVPTNELVVDKNELRLSVDDTVTVVPHWRIDSLVPDLMKDTSLWSNAAIRIQSSRSLIGRARIFGVSFRRAIEESLKQRLVKSVFYVPPEYQLENELYSRLLVRINRRKDNKANFLNLEAWEWIGEGIEIDYAHMIMPVDASHVSHLDCAVIEFDSKTTISNIFSTGDKMKGNSYQKLFRLDGKLSLEKSISLIRRFFPIEELVDEYFCREEQWPTAIDKT